MLYRKRTAKKLVLLLVLLFIVGVGSFFIINRLRSSQTTSNTSDQQQANPQAGSQPTTPTNNTIGNMGTSDFNYLRPEGWSEISKKVLETSGAASGIGRATSPAATFTMKVSSSTPKNTSELKNATIAELKNFSNFVLVANVETKIDGKTGQKFTYTFSDKDGNNKVKQEMSVIVYKQKTFFLLFSSSAADFDKQSAEFTKILSSFKFK